MPRSAFPLLAAALLLALLTATPVRASSNSPNPFLHTPPGEVSVADVRAVGERAAHYTAPRVAALEERAVRGAEAANMTCSQCETYVKVIEALVENNASRASLLALADTKCKALGGAAAVCEAVAKVVIDDVAPWVAAKLSSPPYNALAVCAFLGKCKVDCCADETAPEQVHLSFGNDSTSMAVTWVTQTAPAGSEQSVQWGTSPSDLSKSAGQFDSRTYTFAGWNGLIHGAVMTALKPNATYYYRVGCAAGGWSKVFRFRTMPAAPMDRAARVAVIGDMGLASSNDTRAALIALAQSGSIDAIVVNGDYSYADGAQEVWDVFMRDMEPANAAVPLMLNPGNHEVAFVLGYSYRARFFMPHVTASLNGTVADSQGNFYYSFNVGPLHFAMLSTESVVDTPYVYPAGEMFVRADLGQANLPASRAAQPWVVACGHRPLYCSDGNVQCGAFAGYLRSELEETYKANAVDLVIGSHRHSYSRSWPLFQGVVAQRDYHAAPAPAYVLNGNAGNREGLDGVDPAPWLAAGAGWGFVGYGIIEATADSLVYTQYDASNKTAVDTFTMTH